MHAKRFTQMANDFLFTSAARGSGPMTAQTMERVAHAEASPAPEESPPPAACAAGAATPRWRAGASFPVRSIRGRRRPAFRTPTVSARDAKERPFS